MNSQVTESIGARLKRLRKEKGFDSAQKLGLAAKVDPAYVRRIERDETNPGVEILKKLRNALGCTLDELAGD